MCLLLQLPVDIWCDIVVRFLGTVKEVVRLDLAVAPSEEKETIRKSFAGCGHFRKMPFRNDKKRLIEWCCDAGITPTDVTFEAGFIWDGSPETATFVSNSRDISCQGCVFAPDKTLKSTLESSSKWLKYLLVAHCDLMRMDGLAACGQLSCLRLFGCNNITDKTLVEGLAGLKALESCYLIDCNGITATSIHAVLKYCPGLRTLNITGNFHMEEAFAGLTEPTQLRSFVANGFHATGLSIQQMAHLMPKLRFVHLHAAHSSAQDADMNALARNCPDMLTLELTNFTSIGDASLASIAAHIKYLCNLKLVLDRNSAISDQLDVSGTQVTGALNDALLREEDVGVCMLICDNCSMLTDALVDFVISRPRLFKLSLRGCSLPRGSWIRLAEHLPSRKIESLYTQISPRLT